MALEVFLLHQRRQDGRAGAIAVQDLVVDDDLVETEGNIALQLERHRLRDLLHVAEGQEERAPGHHIASQGRQDRIPGFGVLGEEALDLFRHPAVEQRFAMERGDLVVAELVCRPRLSTRCRRSRARRYAVACLVVRLQRVLRLFLVVRIAGRFSSSLGLLRNSRAPPSFASRAAVKSSWGWVCRWGLDSGRRSVASGPACATPAPRGSGRYRRWSGCPGRRWSARLLPGDRACCARRTARA